MEGGWGVIPGPPPRVLQFKRTYQDGEMYSMHLHNVVVDQEYHVQLTYRNTVLVTSNHPGEKVADYQKDEKCSKNK